MTVQQRVAWYQLAVVGATAAVTGLAFPFLGRPAIGFFGFLGLLGLTPVFFRRRKDQREAIWDERELQIKQRSLVAGFSVFWTYFVLACMCPWFVRMLQHERMITIEYLPLMLIGGMIVFCLVQSIAILAQYRGEPADHD